MINRPLKSDNRQPLIIDSGAITRRIKRKTKTPADVWRLTYGSTCIYELEFLSTPDGACFFVLGSHDLEEIIEECRVRGLNGVRRVVTGGMRWTLEDRYYRISNTNKQNV